MPINLYLKMTREEYDLFTGNERLAVERREMTPEFALKKVVEKFIIPDDLFGGEITRFKQNSGLLFSEEVIFDRLNYRLRSGNRYFFEPPSEHDINTLFQLYKLKSDEPYKSQEELYDIMYGLLAGKRIIELGSGPGLFLNILQSLGAKVSGLDIIKEFSGQIPWIDVRVGDAQDSRRYFGQGDYADIILSRDLLCSANVTDDEAYKILKNSLTLLNPNGYCMHHLTYFRQPLPAYLFSKFLAAQINNEMRSYHSLVDYIFSLQPEQREALIPYTNMPAGALENLERLGYKSPIRIEENGELTYIACGTKCSLN